MILSKKVVLCWAGALTVVSGCAKDPELCANMQNKFPGANKECWTSQEKTWTRVNDPKLGLAWKDPGGLIWSDSDATAPTECIDPWREARLEEFLSGHGFEFRDVLVGITGKTYATSVFVSDDPGYKLFQGYDVDRAITTQVKEGPARCVANPSK